MEKCEQLSLSSSSSFFDNFFDERPQVMYDVKLIVVYIVLNLCFRKVRIASRDVIGQLVGLSQLSEIRLYELRFFASWLWF